MKRFLFSSGIRRVSLAFIARFSPSSQSDCPVSRC